MPVGVEQGFLPVIGFPVQFRDAAVDQAPGDLLFLLREENALWLPHAQPPWPTVECSAMTLSHSIREANAYLVCGHLGIWEHL